MDFWNCPASPASFAILQSVRSRHGPEQSVARNEEGDTRVLPAFRIKLPVVRESCTTKRGSAVVSEPQATKISDHRTTAVFRGYNITTEDRLSECDQNLLASPPQRQLADNQP